MPALIGVFSDPLALALAGAVLADQGALFVGQHLEILADIARTFSDTEAVEQLIQVSTYTEFLAVLRLAFGVQA